LLLTVTPGVTTGAAAAAPGSDRGAGEQHRSSQADEALDAARDLFASRPRANARMRAQGRPGTTDPEPVPAENATAVLADLAQSVPDLAPSERRVARAILARPDDDETGHWGVKYDGAPTEAQCLDRARICLHWVTDPTHTDRYGVFHAPPGLEEDEDGDGVPNSVEEFGSVFEEVWQRVVSGLGYKAPPADDRGPSTGTDVYLADLGAFGMYGYCALENARTGATYCVLDNDFTDFMGDPKESLRVTAAHEFFHAVQFGYSTKVDTWLMEGTAAWIEDEVYDGIDDNVQYLSHSPLSMPGSSLDRIESRSDGEVNWRYGSWIWWRFLTEYLSDDRATDPSVVRRIWERLASSGPNETAMVAQRRVLRGRGTTFKTAFARFGAVNRVAHRWYAEGRSYSSYVAAPSGRYVLTKKRLGTGLQTTRLDHLSTRHAIVRPGKTLRGPWGLRVVMNLPPRFRGSEATAAIHFRDGRIQWRQVRLNRKGDGRLRVPFTRRNVARVALSFTNASTRMTQCGRQGDTSRFACGGVGVDDGLPFKFRARAVR
jgi:hypothetical protein